MEQRVLRGEDLTIPLINIERITNMKRFLSLMLAIIMMISIMPMAFAAEFNHDEFIDVSTKAWSYAYNLYASDEFSTSKQKAWSNMFYLANIFVAVQEKYPQLESNNIVYVEPQELKENPEAGSALTVAYQEAIKYFEDQIADGTFVIQVDASEYMIAMYLPIVTYGTEKVEELKAKVPADMTNRANEADVNYSNLLTIEEDVSSYTQAQFDSDMAFAIEYWNMVYDCLGGKHSIGNNSVTNNDDGTHSYICCFCTENATEEHSFTNGKCACGEETVIDNDKETEDNTNSDNVNKEENNNDGPEETNFIKTIIQKISDFFKSFFERLRDLLKI